MAVRVKIRIRLAEGKSIETVALANAGAETDVPVIALPIELARELNLWPLAKETAVSVKELTSETLGYIAPSELIIELLSESGDKLDETLSHVLVKPGLDEPTLSDALIEALGIIIVKAKWALETCKRSRGHS